MSSKPIQDIIPADSTNISDRLHSFHGPYSCRLDLAIQVAFLLILGHHQSLYQSLEVFIRSSLNTNISPNDQLGYNHGQTCENFILLA